MTDTTNKQTESPMAQPESDSNILNRDDIEESGEDIASLEKQLAELAELKAEIRAKQKRIGTLNNGGNTRPKQAPLHQPPSL